MARAHAHGVALALALAWLSLASGCGLGSRSASLGPAKTGRTTVPAPSPADHGTCADVLDLRVCWDRSCHAGACLVPRTLPDPPEPTAGWRCAGGGATRRCEDAQSNAGPWVCDAQDRCEQRYARVPDDGEWECADLDGVVLCRKLAAVSGTMEGPSDRGWTCGLRRGGGRAERVCVDFAPAFPRGALRGWRCVYEHEGGERRVCTPSRDGPALAGHCDATTPCANALRCVEGRCVPPEPHPTCWIDADCGAGGRCAYGTCAGGGS